MKKEPRILLSCPTYDGKEYCLDYWIRVIKEIQKFSKCDILIIDNSKTDYYFNLIKKYKVNIIRAKHYDKQPLRTLAESRKTQYEYAIKNKYDYLFSLEQDVFPPVDIIKYLLTIRNSLKDKEAVIGSPYVIANLTTEKRPFMQKDYLTNTAIDRIYSKKMKRMIQNNLTRKEMKKRAKVFKVYACGLGCTLIDVSILKKIEIKYTEKQFRPDDAFFFLDLASLHISTYVDPNLMDKVIHIHGSSKTIASWGETRSKIEKD